MIYVTKKLHAFDEYNRGQFNFLTISLARFRNYIFDLRK